MEVRRDCSTVPVERVTASAFTVPTDRPESDGTLAWDSTTLVLAEAYAGSRRGLGYTYSHAAAAKLIDDKLAAVVEGCDALSVTAAWRAMQHAVRNLGVRWFEEPVSSDDLEGLRLLRDHGPPGMEIAAGEYGYDLFYFRRMLEAGAVDVLQADATRCGGITGFLGAGTLCRAHAMDLSAHTAPTLHAHAGCAVLPLRHVEYFYDHARIEHRFFDGALRPADGLLTPDRSRPGLGLDFRAADAEPYRVYGRAAG